MDTTLLILGLALGIGGIIGSVIPSLPGPPLSWIGLLLMYLRGGLNVEGEPMSSSVLLIWLGVTTLVTILDYLVPSWFTKLTGGSKYAAYGAVIGLFLGIFITPVGMILGSLLGAFFAEAIFAHKDFWPSVKAAFGAFLGFLFGMGIKLICCGLMMFVIIAYI